MAQIRWTGDKNREHVEARHGRSVTRLRSAQPGDKGYDEKVAKTVVKDDETGEEFVVLNDEVSD